MPRHADKTSTPASFHSEPHAPLPNCTMDLDDISHLKSIFSAFVIKIWCQKKRSYVFCPKKKDGWIRQWSDLFLSKMSISGGCLSNLITKTHRLWLSANGTTKKLSTSDKHPPSIVISDRNKSDHYRIHPSFFFGHQNLFSCMTFFFSIMFIKLTSKHWFFTVNFFIQHLIKSKLNFCRYFAFRTHCFIFNT